MSLALGCGLSLVVFLAAAPAGPRWPAPQAPAVPQADGYVAIPHVALPPQRTRSYRAVFDATRGAEKPGELVPAIHMAGSELNALAASAIPLGNAKFVLGEAHYRSKFGVSNPNLKAIAALEKAGTKLYVCGQNLAFDGIDPKTLTPDVTVASDALIVLMMFQDDGYALLSF